MDIEKINSIVELFKNSGLDEMTLELKDLKINLKNNKVEYVAKEVANVVEKSNPVKSEKVEEQIDDIKGDWIKAPFVGSTFYKFRCKFLILFNLLITFFEFFTRFYIFKSC